MFPFFRVTFSLLCVACCVAIRPEDVPLPVALAAGLAVAAAAIFCEMKLKALGTRVSAWMAGGAFAGTLAGALSSLAVGGGLSPEARALLACLSILFFGYLGVRIGLAMARETELPVRDPSAPPLTASTAKVLDTSTIIDGRIADVADAGFLDGPVLVAEFILRELQAVADSNDSSKRQRGRRGLDMLERMRNCTRVKVQVVADDFPGVREVDLKLIELAKKYKARLVTNDFNLNKVAQLHDIPVMNVNDLANTLRPVVLPGERLSIAILKEGKEPNQGVGYLNDGTMVVVDHARRWIGQTVELQVTSVLQTPSGKMIFGRYDEAAARASEAMASLPTISH